MAKKDGEWLGGKSRVERKKKRRLVRSRKQGGKGGMEEGGKKRGVGWKGSGSRLKRRGEQGGQEGWRRAVWRGKEGSRVERKDGGGWLGGRNRVERKDGEQVGKEG